VSNLMPGTHFTLLLQSRLFALSLFYRGFKMPMLLHIGKKSSFTTGCGFYSLGEFVWKPLDTSHSINSS